jgi:hypothetical protein
MWFADSRATQRRHEADVTWKDTLIIGTVQCLALIPGVSRSGATMSAGLLREIDRVAVTRLSFFLSIPALTGAGILQTVTEFENVSNGVGWGPTLVATAVSFGVAFLAVSWLLRYIARHTYSVFIAYRVGLGTLVLALVASGALAPVLGSIKRQNGPGQAGRLRTREESRTGRMIASPQAHWVKIRRRGRPRLRKLRVSACENLVKAGLSRRVATVPVHTLGLRL